VLVHTIFEQHEESIACPVPRRLWSEDHQIPYIWVGNDITNQLFDADVFSLDGAGKGSPAFQANSGQVLTVRRNLFLVII
jgi:hypothetical protein